MYYPHYSMCTIFSVGLLYVLSTLYDVYHHHCRPIVFTIQTILCVLSSLQAYYMYYPLSLSKGVNCEEEVQKLKWKSWIQRESDTLFVNLVIIYYFEHKNRCYGYFLCIWVQLRPRAVKWRVANSERTNKKKVFLSLATNLKCQGAGLWCTVMAVLYHPHSTSVLCVPSSLFCVISLLNCLLPLLCYVYYDDCSVYAIHTKLCMCTIISVPHKERKGGDASASTKERAKLSRRMRLQELEGQPFRNDQGETELQLEGRWEEGKSEG